MRIVILTQYFLPEMGAPQNRLFDLAHGLKKLGSEVSVVTALPNYPTGRIFPAYRGIFSHKEYIRDVETKRYWLYPSNSSRTFPRIVSMLSFSFTSLLSLVFIRRKKPDFIFVESPPLTLAFTAWILAKASGARLIMNVSDLWPLSAKELGVISEGTAYTALEKLERFLYKRAFICTGQSQEIVSYIEKIKSGNVYLFRNGVDTTRFKKTADVAVRRNALVYAGLLGFAQGILSICQNINFKELGVEFHIYGSGLEKNAVEKFCLDNPDNGIFYKGIMTREEMPSVLSSYGGSLIVLIKNIYGAVPSKIYEAMAGGLPIIFSGEGEGAEIIRNHEAGWVSTPGDWEMLRNRIDEFKNTSEEKWQLIRSRNKLTAHRNFDRTVQLDQLNQYLSQHL